MKRLAALILILVFACAVAAQAPTPAPAQREPVAVVVVLDVSGSVSWGELAFMKDAARAALSMLSERDVFGALTFNTKSSWAVKISEARNKQEMSDALESIQASGGTNIHSGLQAAYEGLQYLKTARKQVIVLSDGITHDGDFQTVIANMQRSDIAVSTVTVGTASNRQLMSDLAMWGRGRAYYINSYATVADIFKKETETVIAKAVK